MGFPGGAVVKNPLANNRRCKRYGFDPRVGKSPWSRKWQPLHSCCLENPTDRGVWRATVHGVAKIGTWLSNWTQNKHTHTHTHTHTYIHEKLTKEQRKSKNKGKSMRVWDWIPPGLKVSFQLNHFFCFIHQSTKPPCEMPLMLLHPQNLREETLLFLGKQIRLRPSLWHPRHYGVEAPTPALCIWQHVFPLHIVCYY